MTNALTIGSDRLSDKMREWKVMGSCEGRKSCDEIIKADPGIAALVWYVKKLVDYPGNPGTHGYFEIAEAAAAIKLWETGK